MDRLFCCLDGFDAYDSGLTEADCPYQRESGEGQAWLDGYRMAKQDAEDDKAVDDA